ncbi:MAG: hypothetical protein QW035_04680 [Candidatus Anstonellales archaeon]
MNPNVNNINTKFLSICMKKRFWIALLIVMVISITTAYASSKTYVYRDKNKNPLTNPHLYIYGCTNESCSSLNTSYWNSPTTNTSNILTISGNPSEWNKEFHFAECYKVYEYSTNLSWYDGRELYIQLSKESSCSSTPSNLQISGNQAGQPVTITAFLGHVFNSTTVPASNLPGEVHDFYNATVRVELLINDSQVASQEVNVPVEGKQVSFEWTPSQAGSYNITVRTNVTDCKCSSSVVKEASQIVTIEGAGGGGGAINYTLTISVNPPGSGSVIVNDTACVSSVGCPAGTYVLLSAVANANYSFANWSGNASGTSNPLTIVMDSDKSITANFVASGGGGAGQCDCPPATDWSECRLNASGGFSQNRTAYRCDESTGFSCVAFTETRSCVPGVPGMPGCDADGFCVLGCAAGDPDCNCSAQGGRLCAGNLTCPVGYGLRAREAGCCAAQCREYCAREGAVEYCLPGSDRCALMRRCINHS